MSESKDKKQEEKQDLEGILAKLKHLHDIVWKTASCWQKTADCNCYNCGCKGEETLWTRKIDGIEYHACQDHIQVFDKRIDQCIALMARKPTKRTKTKLIPPSASPKQEPVATRGVVRLD